MEKTLVRGFNHRFGHHIFAFFENPTAGNSDAGNVPGTWAAEGASPPPGFAIDGLGVGERLILGTRTPDRGVLIPKAREFPVLIGLINVCPLS